MFQRLKKATRRRGTKAALSRHLGVSRAAVNEWFKGRNAPNPDRQSRLLVWLERAEKEASPATAKPRKAKR
jgi:DNA-binding transcriptional regulator YdaS (Cro superfamily)